MAFSLFALAILVKALKSKQVIRSVVYFIKDKIFTGQACFSIVQAVPMHFNSNRESRSRCGTLSSAS
jgi:hypothetical protein